MIRPTRVAGGLVLVALAGLAAVGWSAAARTTAEPAPGPVVASPTARPSTPATVAARSPTSATAPLSKPPRDELLGPGEVIVEAIAAWGRFAAGGDLSEVEDWFSADGPQFRRFTEEAPALLTKPGGEHSYRVTVSELQVVERGDTAEASARVVFVRTGEPSQPFRWDFDLRRSVAGWKVWTVSEADGQRGPSGRSSGIP